MSFAASANCIVYQGATPVFADVDAGTLLLDPASVEARITRRTRAIIAVDYAGQPCDYTVLRGIARNHGLALVADACHSLGATDRGQKVGTLADASVFSMHPVKPITSGEGGVVTSGVPGLIEYIRRFRNHGLTRDAELRESEATWCYDIEELGFNYRLSDIHCALALSQLERLEAATRRRREIASRYDAAFAGSERILPLRCRKNVEHAYHLYVVRLNSHVIGRNQTYVFRALREAGIASNVHYKPIHLHSFYRRRFATAEGLCPRAEAAYRDILSLPLYAGMQDEEVERVIDSVHDIVGE